MAVNMDAVLRVVAKAESSGLNTLERNLLSIQSIGKGVGSGFSAMGSTLSGLTGGIAALGVGLGAAGLANFVKGTVDAADNMRDLSLKTGISVEMLSKFQQAANMSGSNIEETGKALTKLARNMSEAAMTGKGPAADALRELGLSATDANGKMVPLDEQMLRIADRLAALPDPQRRVALAMDLMGKSGANMIPMLSEGRQAIESMNASFDQKFADDADRYNDSIETLKESFVKLGAVLSKQLLPFMQEVVNKTTDAAIALRIFNLPFAGDKAAEIAAIKNEIIALREARASFGQSTLIPEGPEGDEQSKRIEEERESNRQLAAEKAQREEIKRQQEQQKQSQEAYTFAIERSNAKHELMRKTIEATSQQIQLQSKLSEATLNADITINNAAVSILENKLAQAQTDEQKIPLLRQIAEIEFATAQMQREAVTEQIQAEAEIMDLKRKSAWADLRSAQAALAMAEAYGQKTDALREQVELLKIAANQADREVMITQKIAAQRERAADAELRARQYMIGINRQAPARTPLPTEYSSRQTPSGGGGGGTYVTRRTASGGSVTELVPAYAGGGYTGNAPRTGGIDGRGGFMAVLHPRETVIDHTRGQAGGRPNITIHTGPVIQQADGRQTVSMEDLERGIASAVDQALGIVASPAGRMALGGA